MTAEDEPDLIWEQRWIGRPANTHYSAGGASPLLRENETNRLATHAVIGNRSESPSDSSDPDSEAVRILAVVGALALAAAAIRGATKLWQRVEAKRSGASEDVDAEHSDVTALDEQDALIDEVSALIEETNSPRSQAVSEDSADEDGSTAQARAPSRKAFRRK